MASTRISLEIDDAQKILLKRALNKNGKAATFLAVEIRRLADPYVPLRSGVLKGTAMVTPGKITYGQPYARRQWYEHKGSGMRGPRWVERMWQNRSNEIINSVASYAGCKVE